MTKDTKGTRPPVAPSSGISRRQALTRGAAVAGAGLIGGVTGFPFVNRITALAADAPLKFWQFYGPNGAVPSQSKWYEDTVAEWNKTQDVKVELEYIPTGEYSGGTKLSTAFASGEGPDIFIISPGDFLRYYNGGVLTDLTPYMDAKAIADFPDGVMANRMVDGKIYGIPQEVGPVAMYYSVAAFEEAGLNETNVPKTWDEMLELGKKLTNDKRFGLLFDTSPGYYQNFTWYPFLWQGGGDFQTADGKSALNSPAMVQALKFWQDAVKSGAAPRKPLGGGGWDIVPNLASGFCAMQNIGMWGSSDLANGAPDFKYGVFKLPTPPGGKYVTVGGGWAFVANAKGKNPEAAAKFCVWALGSPDKDAIERVVNWCTVAKSAMPPRNSAFEVGKAAFYSGALKVFTEEVFPGTRGEPRMPPEVNKIISDAVQACQLGGEDPAKQAELASQQFDAFLASYTGAPIL